MDFYYVDSVYIGYLQKFENKKRAVTKFSNMKYDENRNRKLLQVLDKFLSNRHLQIQVDTALQAHSVNDVVTDEDADD